MPSIFSVDQEVRLLAEIEDEAEGARGLRKENYEIVLKGSKKIINAELCIIVKIWK